MTRVATWNVGDGIDATKIHGLVKLRRLGVDVIGLQECGDRGRMLDEFCERTGWRLWLGDEPGSSSTPILWNPRTVQVSALGTRKATDATKAPGRGPDTVKPKVWNHVRVRPLDGHGEPFVFVNGHLPASLYLPRRRALAKKQIAVLADMVERRADRISVVVVGDFNTLPGDPLLKPLRRLGMRQHTKAPTHGRRTIDHVWTFGPGRAEVVKVPSDHRAVVFEAR